MSEFKNYIWSFLDPSEPRKVAPACLPYIEAKEPVLNTVIGFPGRSYLLLSRMFSEISLQDGKETGGAKTDCVHLALLRLCAGLIHKGLSPVIVFDTIDELTYFQKMSTHTVFVMERTSYPSCSLPGDGGLIQYTRNDKHYKRYYYRNKTHSYPKGTKQVNLFLSSDLSFIPDSFDIIIYFKHKNQHFVSGFPKLRTPEAHIEKTIGKLVPFLIFIPDFNSIPIFRKDDQIILTQLGEQDHRLVRFTPHSYSELSKILSPLGKEIHEISDSIGLMSGRIEFSYAIMISIYNCEKIAKAGLDEAVIFRITSDISLENRVRALTRRLAETCLFAGPPANKIENWADIKKIKAKMNDSEQEIPYIKELEIDLLPLFRLLFQEAVIYDKVFEYPPHEKDLEAIKKLSRSILENIECVASEVEYNKDFDPDTAMGYIGSDYDIKAEDGKVDAHYFILENSGRKLIYYCSLGKQTKVTLSGGTQKKSLSELVPGDSIERNYWNYPALKTRVLEYLDENEFRNAGEIRKDLELSDIYRQALDKYALTTDNRELQAKYDGLCKTGNIKGFFRIWANETMCPNSSNYPLFKEVVEFLNSQIPGVKLDPKTLYVSLKAIKDMRALFKDKKDITTKEAYKVLEGPVKIKIEVEKLGKLYRIS